METKTIVVEELRPEDEFWADKPFANCERGGYEDDPENGDYLIFTVLYDPVMSANTNLFDYGDSVCVVVAVEYPDGARGSRLYAPGQIITIRRQFEDLG